MDTGGNLKTIVILSGLRQIMANARINQTITRGEIHTVLTSCIQFRRVAALLTLIIPKLIVLYNWLFAFI